MLENGKCTILWDFAIQAYTEIKHRRSDIVINDKEKRKCKIIDIAVVGGYNINARKIEKITKCNDLILKVKKLWNVKATAYSTLLVLWEQSMIILKSISKL